MQDDPARSGEPEYRLLLLRNPERAAQPEFVLAAVPAGSGHARAAGSPASGPAGVAALRLVPAAPSG